MVLLSMYDLKMFLLILLYSVAWLVSALGDEEGGSFVDDPIEDTYIYSIMNHKICL